MHTFRLGMSLLVMSLLAACGDASSPDQPSAASAPDAGGPGPWDTLAKLAPADQPYGLDVYTAKCLSCHGDLGQGSGKAPALKGIPPRTLQQTLLDYRSGKRPGGKDIGKAELSDAEIAAVAVYAGD